MSDIQKIDALLEEIRDWRGDRLRWFRTFVHENAPELEEALKWGVCVFVYKGKPVMAMSGFKDHTKFNFFHGSSLNDPKGLFNSGLESKDHRSINLAENEKIDEAGLSKLIRQAVELAQS